MTSEEVDGKMIYSVNDGDLVACFADDITENIVKAMADKQPLRVLFRDSCLPVTMQNQCVRNPEAVVGLERGRSHKNIKVI